MAKGEKPGSPTFGTWPILLALAGVVLVALIVVFLILRVRNRDWKSPGEDVAAPSATQAVSTTALPVVPPRTATLTTAGFPAEEDFVVVSGPASPRVAYAMVHGPGKLSLVLDVAMPKGAQPGTAVAVGLAAAHKVVLTEHDAQVHPRAAAVRYTFTISPAVLIATEADWGRLRMGIAVAWKGGPLGADRQRERFLHFGGAPHAGLSTEPADWKPLDLREYDAVVADARRRITWDFPQPMDGKATVVIDDQHGRRVRNLLSGVSMAQGRQHLVWDGLDDAGNVVKPAEYRWRAISHPGIRPEYLFSFCNDGQPPWRTGSGTDMWGPDHSCLTAATAGREWTFLAGRVAESGYAIVAIDQQGTKRKHYKPPPGTGLNAVALATDDHYLYVAHDGLAWGQKVDRTRPGWKAVAQLTLTRFAIDSGQVVPFHDHQPFVVIGTSEVGPGSPGSRAEGTSLGGLAWRNGKLYVSNRLADTIIELDTDSGRRTGEIRVKAAGALAAVNRGLYAISGRGLVAIQSETRQVRPLSDADVAEPVGLAVDKSGRLYVSDAVTHTVRICDAMGRAVGQLGKPGGRYTGRYDPQRMVNPRGLAVAANGWLWVTEDRQNPKRVVAWDPETKRVMKEEFGPPPYGATGAGMDDLDHARWIGQGATWQLDFTRQTATPRSILNLKPGHFDAYAEPTHYTFCRQDGRTFVLASGHITALAELRPDGSLHDLAATAQCHQFAYGCGWEPPQAYIDAFFQAYPDKRKGTGLRDRAPYAEKGPGMLWVDRNGDGRMQPDEFSFSTNAENYGGAAKGNVPVGLTLKSTATVGGRAVLVTLKPDGYYPGGAPRYPPLPAAIARARPIPLAATDRGAQAETIEDRFGNLIFNSTPEMTALGPDGQLLWSFPNRWVSVHGSHDAPLPETGVMQGALFFRGRAPLDERSDVMVITGNHGRSFVLTTDGLYLDEMFKDVRMCASIDAYLVGGECFGGSFARSARDDNYYLQCGHSGYRLFRLHGLDQVRRTEGIVRVTPEQAQAAAANQARTAATSASSREAAIPYVKKPPSVDGHGHGWPSGYEIRWDRSGKFPVKVWAAYDDRYLYLHYEVSDPSPWVNGRNVSTGLRQLLFGISVAW